MTRQPLLLAAALVASCGGPPKPPPAEPPLAIAPLADIVPSAGLQTLVLVKPKALYAQTDLRPAIDELLPEEDMLAFATRHGSVDPRQLDEVAVGIYPHTTLVLGSGVVDPTRVEQAFGARTLGIDGRKIDHAGSALTTVTRAWAEAAVVGSPNHHEELVTFGRSAVGWQIDDPPSTPSQIGPLRASELFALKKLAKSRPALAAPPLDSAASTFGDAPVRMFFLGPFEGEWATAMGGLLRAATAVGASATSDGSGNLRVTVGVFGAFGDKAPQAAERLAGVVDVLGQSALGKLAGLDHPVSPFQARSTPDSAVIEGRIDARQLVRGVRAATGAQIAEIMKQ